MSSILASAPPLGVDLSQPKAAFDVTRAAQYLGVSASYLNRLRTTGGGPIFIKIGNRVTYRPVDLDAYQAQHARTSTSNREVA